MTSKERILTALNHKEPDRIPIIEVLYSRKLYKEIIGRIPDYYNAEDVFECAKTLGLDAGIIPIEGFPGIRTSPIKDEEYQDEWHITYRKDEGVSWPGDTIIGYPLKNKEDWKKYKIPDVNKPGRLKEIEIAIKKGKEYNMAVFGDIRGPFSATWMLFGYEKFCLLLYEDPDLLDEVITEVTDFYLSAGKILLDAGVDVIFFADDYGYSTGPLLSPEHYEKHIWPQLSRLLKGLKANNNKKVIMHSDGDLKKILPSIIKTGVDGYHPIERKAGMDLAKIKKEYGDKLVLIGNVNNIDTLVFGSKEDVINETMDCIKIAAPGGGYILSSDHSVHDDIPNENILSMIETGKKYGIYPISND